MSRGSSHPDTIDTVKHMSGKMKVKGCAENGEKQVSGKRRRGCQLQGGLRQSRGHERKGGRRILGCVQTGVSLKWASGCCFLEGRNPGTGW